jgi:hypothetical protein
MITQLMMPSNAVNEMTAEETASALKALAAGEEDARRDDHLDDLYHQPGYLDYKAAVNARKAALLKMLNETLSV